MSNGIENHDNKTQVQCNQRPWCDEPNGHHVDHAGEADLPKITATGYREDFVHHDDGVAVPEVFARLEEHGASNSFDRFVIRLGIIKPDGGHAACFLSVREAELLAKALIELDGIVRSAR